MSRTACFACSLLLLTGVIAALVGAQEPGRSAPASKALPPSAAAGGGDIRLVQHLQRVGQSVSAEYQGGSITPTLGQPSLTPPGNGAAAEPRLLLTAHEAASGGELRSVLTRRSTAGESSSPAPLTSTEPLTSPAPLTSTEPPAQPATPPPSQLAAPPAQEPGLLETVPPAVGSRSLLSEPPANAGTLPLVGESGNAPADAARSSSRRTFTSPEASSSIPLVASKPVGGSASTPQSSAAPPATDTLSSTTGALLRVSTVGPAALTVGVPGQLSVRLSNLGSTDARDVVVRVGIPQNLEMIAAEVDDGSTRIQPEAASATLLWNLDHVPARAERVLSLKAIPRSTAPLELAVDWSVAPITAIAQIQIQEPRLELALRGPRELVYGETKVFTVVVANPGSGEARDVSLHLSLGEQSADTLRVGTIAAGASREFDVEVTARQAGPMHIVASASGAPQLQAEAQEQVQVRRADLQIEALGSAAKYAGSVGTYQVRVVNAGDAPAENVQAAVRLPLGAKYVEGLENAGQEGADLKWPIGGLRAGEERVYRFFCQLGEEGDARFEFLVSSPGGLQAAAGVLTQVQAIADLKMSVNDPKGPVAVGQETVWEIQLTNRGTKAATQVQVVAQFSEGVEPVGVEGGRAELVPGQVVFQPLARLGAGETIKLTVRAKADREGNHLFRAELRCSDPEYRLVAEDTTTFYGDELMASPVKPATAAAPAPARTAPPQQLPARPAGWMAK